MNQKLTLESYLKERYNPKTILNYQKDINNFIHSIQKPKSANREDIVLYLSMLRKKYPNPRTLQRVLSAIKKYYNYLIFIGVREDNPANGRLVVDVRNKNVRHGLLSKEDIKSLENQLSDISDNSSKSLLSLIVFQALTLTDIKQLTKHNIDINKGLIHIKSTSQTNSRTLDLKPMQILSLFKHLENVREFDILFNLSNKAIQYRLSKCFKIENKKPSPDLIRRSVIAYWIEQGVEARKVQYMSGLQRISSVMKYRNPINNEFRDRLKDCHPLG